MNQYEKSVALAQACGWPIDNDGNNVSALPQWQWLGDALPNLYRTTNMALAWRVMTRIGETGLDDTIGFWFSSEFICMEDPEVAQEKWLDKCLALVKGWE